MNYDEYGFPIFDEDYEDDVIKIDVGVIKQCSVESVNLTINLKKDEEKSSNLLFDI